jgi:polyisoprenoid-binding protein YceI
MRARLAAGIVAALVVAGCAAPVREAAKKPAVPEEFPESHYREALAAGKPVYRVDPKESLVVIEVRRAGKFANLGHDHVVASHDVRGWIAPQEGRADLYVPLEDLAVDEPALRKASGFTTQPSENDIEGTRANMREKVLEAEKFPFALVRVTGADAKVESATLAVAVTLHGTTRAFKVAAKLETGAERMTITGRLSFDQTGFGITPYSVLGGAVAVRDRVDLRFDIVAHRAPARAD